MFAPKVAKPQTKTAKSAISRLVPQRSTLVGHQLRHAPVEDMLFLQRTLGNQATSRLLARQFGKSPPWPPKTATRCAQPVNWTHATAQTHDYGPDAIQILHLYYVGEQHRQPHRSLRLHYTGVGDL